MTPGFIRLRPHPLNPADGIHAVAVRVDRDGSGGLDLRYRLHGDPARLRVPPPCPPPCPPARADGLWAHLCFELFVALEGEDAYREFNFSPSGEWALYAFRAVRERIEHIPRSVETPQIAVRIDTQRLELDAHVPAAALPAGATTGRDLRVGLASVIECVDGTLSYWALRHPAGRPDFHDRESFALTIRRAPVPAAPRPPSGSLSGTCGSSRGPSSAAPPGTPSTPRKL